MHNPFNDGRKGKRKKKGGEFHQPIQNDTYILTLFVKNKSISKSNLPIISLKTVNHLTDINNYIQFHKSYMITYVFN